MGKFANVLCKITNSLFISDNKGKSLEIEAEALAGDNIKNDMFYPPGIMSRPPDGTYALFVPYNDSRSNGVIIGINNYKLSINIEKGETLIYSTDSSGNNIKSKIKLDNNGDIDYVIDGKFAFDNNAEKLKVLIDDLIDEIIAIQTQGSPVNHVLNPSSIANFQSIKNRFANLLKEAT